MKKNLWQLSWMCAILLSANCANRNVSTQLTHQATDSTKGLKDYYSGFFPIGVAVSPRALKTDEAALILQHFNSITPENAMKMGPIHPREHEYFWRDADSIVAFGKRHGLKV